MTISVPCGEKIIKAGKSKNTLDKRSYSCGTEHQWTHAACTSIMPVCDLYNCVLARCSKKVAVWMPRNQYLATAAMPVGANLEKPPHANEPKIRLK